MEFHKYQHIMKLGTDEVDGILNGTVSLFYKIDGTNSQVFLKNDGTLGFGSRNKEITPANDNAGFALSMTQNEELYNGLLTILKAHPNPTTHGEMAEWLKALVLKTSGAYRAPVGSKPTLSSNIDNKFRLKIS